MVVAVDIDPIDEGITLDKTRVAPTSALPTAFILSPSTAGKVDYFELVHA